MPLAGFLLVLAVPARSNQEEQTGSASTAKQPNAAGGSRMIIEMKPGDTLLAERETEPAGKLSRWLDLQTVSLSGRYHFIENSASETTNNQAQYQATFRGRIKLDSPGKYSIHAGLFPGNRFSGGWNSTGWGTGPPQSNLHLKQLYFMAQPVRGVEVQYGGLYFHQGLTTEITGYDYDGYLMGERVRLTRPKELFFDEVSITYGYVGDLDRPSVSKRFRRLKQSNYHQFLLAKKIGGRVSVSGDYTFESGVDTLHEAIKVRVPELRFIEVFHFENYYVVTPVAGYGFSVYGEKKLAPKLNLGGGYAQHDRPGLYSDRFAQGKRVFGNLQLEFSPEFSLSIAVTQAIRNESPTGPRTRMDVAINYDVLQLLRKSSLF